MSGGLDRGADDAAVIADGIREALRFFDPYLADRPRGPELVTGLLSGIYPDQPIVIAADEADELISRLRYHRLEAQLIDALGRAQVVVEGGRTEMLQAYRATLAVGVLELERLLIGVGQALDEAGVEFLVLKGMATGVLDHPPGTLRQAADVDLLVRPSDYRRAATAIEATGLRPPEEATTLMDKGGAWRVEPGGMAVDLHTRPHTAGRDLGQHWWRTADTFEVAGRTFRALDRGGRLGHAASHLALSFPNHRMFSSLRDLVVVARTANDDDRVEAERFLADVGVGDLAWRITTRAAPLVPGEQVVVGRAAGRGLDRVLRRAYDRPDLDKMALKLAKTYGMPWTERRRVLRNWLSPSPTYLAAGGYGSRWDRYLQVAGRRIPHRGRSSDESEIDSPQ